ncbi:MAG: hypothetical protein HYY76_00890 [Acidobacteria bacterium]|nr:hypothetical protein [Acidobacteriota bacterium]
MTEARGDGKRCIASSSRTARSEESESVAVSVTLRAAAAGSVIQRGTFTSRPSGPRTVIGSSVRRGAETTASCIPASGWKG